MATDTVALEHIPAERRDAFAGYTDSVRRAFGENLLGLSGYGGWLAGDPFYERAPATSVVVLKLVDLEQVDGLASEGRHFGGKNIRAPLVMTPEYIGASADVFPLELLEIQQLQAVVLGDDHFADVALEPGHIRHACERELKSELVHLRQGLLSAAGRRNALRDLAYACADRTVRVLRGLLKLERPESTARTAEAVATEVSTATGSALPVLSKLLSSGSEIDFAVYRRLYVEVNSLAAMADRMVHGQEGPDAGADDDSKKADDS